MIPFPNWFFFRRRKGGGTLVPVLAQARSSSGSAKATSPSLSASMVSSTMSVVAVVSSLACARQPEPSIFAARAVGVLIR